MTPIMTIANLLELLDGMGICVEADDDTLALSLAPHGLTLSSAVCVEDAS